MKVVLVTICGLLLGLSVIIFAQERAHFQRPGLVAEQFDANPARAIAVLEGLLTQEQLDAVEAALIPAPTPEEAKLILERVQRELSRLPEARELQEAVTAAIAELRAEPIREAEPVPIEGGRGR